jgi:hypothetical protein
MTPGRLQGVSKLYTGWAGKYITLRKWSGMLQKACCVRLQLTPAPWTVPQCEIACLYRIQAGSSILEQGKIMATSSVAGGSQASEETSGKDIHSLGPSDNPDSGSDAVGAYGDDELSGDSDAAGTGERATIGPGLDPLDADILPDRVEYGPGDDADGDLDDEAGDDFNDSGGVKDLADDSEDPGTANSDEKAADKP